MGIGITSARVYNAALVPITRERLAFETVANRERPQYREPISNIAVAMIKNALLIRSSWRAVDPRVRIRKFHSSGLTVRGRARFLPFGHPEPVL